GNWVPFAFPAASLNVNQIGYTPPIGVGPGGNPGINGGHFNIYYEDASNDGGNAPLRVDKVVTYSTPNNINSTQNVYTYLGSPIGGSPAPATTGEYGGFFNTTLNTSVPLGFMALSAVFQTRTLSSNSSPAFCWSFVAENNDQSGNGNRSGTQVIAELDLRGP